MVGRELSAGRHQKADVRRVLQRLIGEGWQLRKASHWGRLYCPCGCTVINVFGTPSNPSTHARRIALLARRCPLPEGDPRRAPGA